jgi:hypothetical protein
MISCGFSFAPPAKDGLTPGWQSERVALEDYDPFSVRPIGLLLQERNLRRHLNHHSSQTTINSPCRFRKDSRKSVSKISEIQGSKLLTSSLGKDMS